MRSPEQPQWTIRTSTKDGSRSGAASTGPSISLPRDFLQGSFRAVYDKGPDSYEVSEIKSLVKGDAVSEFAITMK